MLNWRFFVAVFLIVGAFLLAVCGYASVLNSLDQLRHLTEDVQAQAFSDTSVEKLLAFWDDQKNKPELFVESEEIAALDEAFDALKSVRKSEDMQAIQAAVDKIAMLAQRLREKEKITAIKFF